MLKKTLLAAVVAVAFASPAFSQETNSTFKPQTSDITAEVLLNLANKEQNTFFIEHLRGRYFFSPSLALRAGAFFRYWDSEVNNRDTDVYNYSLSISPGIEKHLAGTEKLSPYIGCELVFNKDFHNNSHSIINNGTVVTYSGSQTIHGLGINLVAGTDYYVAKKLYLGAEFGLGFTYSHFYNKTTHPEDVIVIPTTYVNESFSLYNFTRGGIRVGFVF